jgi:hypothetical protein
MCLLQQTRQLLVAALMEQNPHGRSKYLYVTSENSVVGMNTGKRTERLGSLPGRSRRFFFSPKHPDWCLSHFSPSSRRISSQDVKLHSLYVKRLRMRESLSLPFHYFTTHIVINNYATALYLTDNVTLTEYHQRSIICERFHVFTALMLRILVF